VATELPNQPTFLSLQGGNSQPLSIRAKALVFADPASRRMLEYIEKLAPSEAPVLIVGETGTGKELVARHIHHLSGRKGPFLAVNCGAISDQLAESELFGHEAGSFTGAVGRREGWFEAANGGTLFLDEIGDLPLPLQVKMLRVLQEREVVRIGSRKSIPIDVRLVAATNIDLDHAVMAGHFRRDLLYRLNIAQTHLPPLRDRPGDVLPLAHYFLRTYCQRMGREATPGMSAEAIEELLAYAWPGNIRELENVMHFALLVSHDEEIQPEHLKVARHGGPGVNNYDAPKHTEPVETSRERGSPLEVIAAQLRQLFVDPGNVLFDELEGLIITEAYHSCGRNQVQSAALLGVTRNVVRTLLKRHGLLQDESSRNFVDGGALRSSGLPSSADVF
jgi:DNA-binding NtrC family response regulator